MERESEPQSNWNIKMEQFHLPLKDPDKSVLDQLGSYLAAFGNHEAKCLALLSFFNTQEIVDKYKLKGRVSNMTNNIWEQHPDAIENYCRGSFCEIGLVTKEAIDRGLNHYGYMLTEDGLARGQPIAAYLLLEGHKYKQSLYDFFGATQSTADNRSPQDSFTVLNMTAMIGSLTPSEISKKTGIKLSTVSGNLKRLRKHGIVEFENVSIDTRGSVKYKLKNGSVNTEPEPVSRDTSLTQDVWSILKTHEGEGLNYDDVVSLIRTDPILSLEKYAFTQSLKERISIILAGINRQGLLEKNTRGVSIPDQIKPFIEEVFPKLIAFIEGDSAIVREFNHAKTVILGENEEAKKIRENEMKKAREKSPWSPENTIKMAIHLQVIKDYLLHHPDARPFEIATAIGTSKETVLRVLKKINDEESKLSKKKGGRATRYRIKD